MLLLWRQVTLLDPVVYPAAIKAFAREICRNDVLNFGRCAALLASCLASTVVESVPGCAVNALTFIICRKFLLNVGRRAPCACTLLPVVLAAASASG